MSNKWDEFFNNDDDWVEETPEEAQRMDDYVKNESNDNNTRVNYGGGLSDVDGVNLYEVDSEEKIIVNDAAVAAFMKAVSGVDINGRAKATVSYQAYALKDDGTPDEDAAIYTLANAEIELSYSKITPEYYTLDVIFPSADSTELKLFWGRLQEHKRNESRFGDKTWIFYINILEVESLEGARMGAAVAMVNVLNPLLFYLTRTLPNEGVEERERDGELLGGNIVRMLLASPLVSFETRGDIDANELYAEALRDEEASRFLDADQDDGWVE